VLHEHITSVILCFIQVGPALLVLGEEARENGLKYSIQERLENLYMSKDLAEIATSHIFHLNVNYRCHVEIMKILNNLFYKKEIISKPMNANSHPMAPYPLLFVCSSLDTQMEPWKEAKILLDVLQKSVIENWPEKEWGVKNLSNVSVIAASRTQVLLCFTYFVHFLIICIINLHRWFVLTLFPRTSTTET